MPDTDAELLKDFSQDYSQISFSRLVERYSGLVFAAARRQVGDSATAEDITQATFLVLANKSASVRADRLPAWLLTTTRLCAKHAIRARIRRTRHERKAAMTKPEIIPPAVMPDALLIAALDDGMSRLPSRDCTAIAMRYLQNRSVNDVAVCLGVSPDAAQKILARGLAKLRRMLTGRGVGLSSVGVLTAAMLHESTRRAPAAMLIDSSNPASASMAIAKGASNMMLWSSVKIATAMILIICAGSIVILKSLFETTAAQSASGSTAVQLYLASSVAAASPLNGDWIGGFDRPESYVFVHTHFRTMNNKTTGTIDWVDAGNPLTPAVGEPLGKVELSPSLVHFETSDKDSPISFEGQTTNGVMTGVVQDRAMKLQLPFRLDLMAKIDLSKYVGIYQVGPGHFITIAPTSPPITLRSLDTQSGETKILLSRSDTDFVGGSGRKIYPVQATLHFTTNELGQIAALQWKPQAATAMVGTRIKALSEEVVSFTNGDVTLSGTLVLPPTKGPYPAVVIVPGSGPSVRSQLRVYSDFFALNGVATLIYDKRGCGSSTGDWQKSGFDDLAGDALAGLELLKKRPDINPHQIGLWGGSQGGWIIGLAASRSKDVAFIISVSGPGIKPEEQAAYCVQHWMEAGGYSRTELDEARSLSLLTYQCRATNRGWNDLETARKAAQDKPWYNACPYLDRDARGVDKLMRLTWGYDPALTLRKVQCPVLAVFGELDPLLPVQKSADIWQTALAEADNHDVVIKIFPHADHGMADPRTGTQVPSYFALERDWLLEHITINPN